MNPARVFRGMRYSWARLPEGRKVDWFINRRLQPWLLRGVELEMRGKNYHAALYLMLLSVEILSGFWAGCDADLGTFTAFMRSYFKMILSTRVPNPLYRSELMCAELRHKKEVAFSEILWALFRRGFENACTAYPGFSLTGRSRYYCRFYRRIGLRMDVTAFYRDFARACRSYFGEVYGDYLVRQRFINRFDQVFTTFKIPPIGRGAARQGRDPGSSAERPL